MKKGASTAIGVVISMAVLIILNILTFATDNVIFTVAFFIVAGIGIICSIIVCKSHLSVKAGYMKLSAEYHNLSSKLTCDAHSLITAEKVINYQQKEAHAIAQALEGRAQGELTFDYVPAEGDEDTKATYEDFCKIQDNISNSVQITKSYVDEIVQAMQKMADNDFDFTMAEPYLGDFAPIKQSIHVMIDSVSMLMKSIQITSMLVRATSNEIANEEEFLVDNFKQQVDTIKSVTNILNNLSAQAQKNANDANEVKQLSLEIRKTAENGNESMHNLGNAMEAIKQSSSEIAKVSKMVEELAFRITILSINASIEAAHAGDAGLGFAVVANEVRDLAVKSTNAAKETTEMINTSIENIKNGYTLAGQTAQVLDEIVRISMNESDGLINIADESDAQVGDLIRISTSMEEISNATLANMDIVVRNASACRDLATLAAQLEGRIAQFKVKKNN